MFPLYVIIFWLLSQQCKFEKGIEFKRVEYSGTFQPREEKTRGDLTSAYKQLMRGCKKIKAKLFSVVSSDRTRGNGQKLKYKNSHLNVTKKTFAMEMFKYWRVCRGRR